MTSINFYCCVLILFLMIVSLITIQKGPIMKTYRVIRTEKIQEVKIIKAKNEDDAIEKMTYDNWDDCEILSSEIDTEEVQL